MLCLRVIALCYCLSVVFVVCVSDDSIMLERCYVFFFQAEDGIRDLVRSRGLGDVYKRQIWRQVSLVGVSKDVGRARERYHNRASANSAAFDLSLIHI